MFSFATLKTRARAASKPAPPAPFRTAFSVLYKLGAFALVAFATASAENANVSAAETSDSAIRQTLLSDEFFDDFFGAKTTTIRDFQGAEFDLPFASDKAVERFYVDAPLDVDCSRFDRFAITTDLTDVGAVSYATLYFHSGDGWHSSTGRSRRNADGSTTFLFDAKTFRTEGAPDSIANADKFRFALWRGGAIDAKVSIRELKASSVEFGVLDVPNDDGENGAIIESFGNLLTFCGLGAALVDAKTATAESLSRYPVLFLPSVGGIDDATVDALCEYVDAGGYLFAFYWLPDKLARKLGFLPGEYIRPAAQGVRLATMKFEPELVEDAARRGFELPSEIQQDSWNIIAATPNPDWETTRESAVFGGNKARVLAVWADDTGRSTDWPAILTSPCGFYCSHIFLSQDVDARRKTLETFVGAEVPNVSSRFLAAAWRSIFAVGLDPKSDLLAEREKTLDFALDYLAKKGWGVADVGEFLGVVPPASAADFDRARFAKFSADVAELAQFRVDEYAETREARPNEGRLWWEHSGTGIYPGDWDRTMKELADAGFNAVVPNMLWGGVAYYESDVLPRDPKVEKYGDQIARAVAAGKKYGVETHVWKVCFNASNAPKEFLAKASAEGRLQRTFDGEEKPWLCPSNPENRALELASLEEVATKYDVDGIHFDYVRYPDDNCCYCEGCKERFSAFYREKTGKKLADFPKRVRADAKTQALFDEWRRAQITALVRVVRESLSKKAPDVLISAAVFSGYPGCRDSIAQDWVQWVDDGLLDFVCPMDYTSDPTGFGSLVAGQLKLIGGKVPLYPGIGATATGISMRPEEALLQAEIAKEAGAQGFAIFNLTKATADAILPAFQAGATSEKTPFPGGEIKAR